MPMPSRGHGTPCFVLWLLARLTNHRSENGFMRLTLRTLLAYMDGILEPADRDEIGRKIEESEFARQLVQRLRDSTRNPRLSAPRVTGKGMGPDPNTVAEYLDNTLAGERVPEFEKLCLDSDIDLAEVAGCHQILTMVLGQPAEIDMEMKQHMYEVVNHSSPVERKAGEMPEHVAGVPDDMWVKPKRRKPEIPDYLREQPSGSKWKTYAAAAILLGVVAVAVMVALGPLDRTHPMARLLGFGQGAENQPAAPEANAKTEPSAEEKASAAEKIAPVAEKNGPGAEQPATTESTERTASGAAGASTVNSATANTAAPNTAASNTTVPEGSAAENGKASEEKSAANRTDNGPSAATSSSATPDAAIPNAATVNAGTPSIATPNAAASDATSSTGVTAPSATTENVPAANMSAAAPGPATNASVPPQPVPTARSVPVTPPQAADNRPAAADNRPTPGDLSQPTPPPNMPNIGGGNVSSIPATSEAATPPAPPVANVPSVPVGRLVPSKESVLLKYDAGSSSWIRVPSGKAVMSNEPLLVLPTYRPTITLSSGLTLQVPAETLLELEAPDGRGILTVKVIYGRLVVLTAGTAGAQLGLDLGGFRGVVSFVDADATLGVEVIRHFPAGANPEVQPPEVTADLYAARGKLEWTPTGGQAAELDAVQMLSLNRSNAGAGPTPAAAMPKWIEPQQLRSSDVQASDFLAQSLLDDKPLAVALQEMVEHRKVEYKSLGAQCLAQLDDFEPLVAALNDSEQRMMWPVEIASVKAALTRGAGTAAKVHEAFVKQHGEKLGKDLYRMLLGYTKDQLQAGEAGNLVNFLDDNDSLDCRVLAFFNLEEITNKTFYYRPEATAANRALPLRRWQEELKNNAIVPKEAGGAK
jgi:hypothetical protein